MFLTVFAIFSDHMPFRRSHTVKDADSVTSLKFKIEKDLRQFWKSQTELRCPVLCTLNNIASFQRVHNVFAIPTP